VRVPRCRYTASDPDTGHGLVVMDDVVAAGGRFLTALEPYSPEQARRSLDQLAALHAAHWDGAGTAGAPWLRHRLAELVEQPLRTVAELQEQIDDERGDPLPAAVRDAGRIIGALGALVTSTAGRPATLVHGDAHAGNLYVQDGATALVDWQLVQRAHWSIDVAYHVGAALSVDDRRAADRDLLDHYLDRLASLGVAAPDRETAWTAYRAGVAYGFYLWSITRKVDPAITHEFCRRLGTAVADLDSFALLGV
jgi:aminoglycoside phosphotransferase (APT) family kinase protein